MPTGTGIQVVWPNRAEPRATLVFKAKYGRLRERVVGPRALLTIEEAAAVLERPVVHVRRAIKARLLRANRGITMPLANLLKILLRCSACLTGFVSTAASNTHRARTKRRSP